MEGFGLILGHLLGDYVLQNDWQAGNKTNPHPGRDPHFGKKLGDMSGSEVKESLDYHKRRRLWVRGHLACTVHCLLYTLAVWACSFWWMPWWGLVICFAAHWPIDRFRLARAWMVHVSGQTAFATGPLAPWSVIVVDNTFHLLTLFLIALAAGLLR